MDVDADDDDDDASNTYLNAENAFYEQIKMNLN